MIRSYGISIDRGSSDPIVFRFKDEDEDGNQTLFDLTGSRLILTIAAKGVTLLRKDTELDPAATVIDPAAATLTVALTPAETRLIPLGRVASYEVERWLSADDQSLMARGYVEGSGGINND